jgi:hypothetical protein
MKPQRCKKWEFGRSRVRTRRDTKFYGYGVTYFCPLTILPVRRLPSRRSAGAGDAENNKRRGGRGRRSSDPSALSPLLSSSGVVAAAVLQFLLLSIVLPQIQFVVCDSRRDFTGASCAFPKNQVSFAAKLAQSFVLSVSIYCCCCCCCWSWVVF